MNVISNGDYSLFLTYSFKLGPVDEKQVTKIEKQANEKKTSISKHLVYQFLNVANG